jgi:hypothetical protein
MWYGMLLQNAVQDAIAECDVGSWCRMWCFLGIFPGWYTLHLLPMDLSGKRPFNNGIRSSYDAFYIKNDFDRNPRR